MQSYPLSEQLARVARPEGAHNKLQEQVSQLFLEARDDVYRYLLSLGLYPPQAQEAVQEVFLRLYSTLKKGEAIDNPRAWIFRVAHNWGLKVRSHQSSQVPFDPDLASGPVSALRSGEMNPEQSLLERERTARFQQAVGRLSEQQRRCLFLRMEGLRYPEIGSVLGISASTVGEFLRRAIGQLKKSEAS